MIVKQVTKDQPQVVDALKHAPLAKRETPKQIVV
jgi:hypothetical protein